MSVQLPTINAQDVRAMKERKLWQKDPVRWSDAKLRCRTWSKQAEILYSVVANRKTTVKACHGSGKSFIAANAVAWWLDVWRPGEAFVVTTAPTNRQVKAILWREISRAHARGALRGRTNQNEWFMEMPSGKEELVAFGIKPADYNPDSFQGVHQARVLVVLDEACGIRGPIWEAADSLLSNDDCRMLIIGNPDVPNGEFAEICKPGSGANTITISAFDTPNFTGEKMPPKVLRKLVGRTWVEEKRKKWAPDWTWTEDGSRVVPPVGKTMEQALTECNPYWVSKILGIFPSNEQEGGLIPLELIRQATQREFLSAREQPIEFGVDVGAGGDSSTVGARWGRIFRVLHEDKNPDTMQTCGKIVELRKKWGPSLIKIDNIGIGKGILDRGVELGEPFVGISVGEQAVDDKQFPNFRAELWWAIRERFEAGEIDLDPRDEDLLAELASLRYKRNSRGQIVMESKQEAKRRGVASPNRADSLMLCFAKLKEAEKKKKAAFLFAR